MNCSPLLLFIALVCFSLISFVDGKCNDLSPEKRSPVCPHITKSCLSDISSFGISKTRFCPRANETTFCNIALTNIAPCSTDSDCEAPAVHPVAPVAPVAPPPPVSGHMCYSDCSRCFEDSVCNSGQVIFDPFYWWSNFSFIIYNVTVKDVSDDNCTHYFMTRDELPPPPPIPPPSPPPSPYPCYSLDEDKRSPACPHVTKSCRQDLSNIGANKTLLCPYANETVFCNIVSVKWLLRECSTDYDCDWRNIAPPPPPPPSPPTEHYFNQVSPDMCYESCTRCFDESVCDSGKIPYSTSGPSHHEPIFLFYDVLERKVKEPGDDDCTPDFLFEEEIEPPPGPRCYTLYEHQKSPACPSITKSCYTDISHVAMNKTQLCPRANETTFCNFKELKYSLLPCDTDEDCRNPFPLPPFEPVEPFTSPIRSSDLCYSSCTICFDEEQCNSGKVPIDATGSMNWGIMTLQIGVKPPEDYNCTDHYEYNDPELNLLSNDTPSSTRIISNMTIVVAILVGMLITI